MKVSRRDFLRSSRDQAITFSFWGRAIAYSTLPFAVFQSLWTGRAFAASTAPSLKHIKPTHIPVIIAFTKVSLGLDDRDLNSSNNMQFISHCDILIDQAPATVRSDLILLFNLLQFPMSRWMMGIRSEWEQAHASEVNALIQNWNYGGIKILRYGYQSLVSLLQLGWFSLPTSAEATGYPGPPDSIRPYIESAQEFSP
jgi:hypothetical protein